MIRIAHVPPHPLLLRSDRWRARLEDQLAHLPAEPAAEQWHELRESLGRLAAWLRMANRNSLREQVRELRRAIGEIRDLEIVRELYSPSVPRARSLGRDQARMEAILIRRLAAPATAELLQCLQETPPLNYESAVEAARRMARRAWKAGRRFADDPTPATAHRLRRRLRELRFAREWLRQETAPLRPLVRRLGRLNDRMLVQHFMERNGGDGEAADKIDRSLARCRSGWRTLRGTIKEWAR